MMEFYGKILTNEKVEEMFTLKSQSVTSVLDYAENVDLNFTRNLSGSNFQVNFNYHHAGLTSQQVCDVLSGSIQRYYVAAQDLLCKLYEATEFSPIVHNFNEILKEKIGREV